MKKTRELLAQAFSWQPFTWRGIIFAVIAGIAFYALALRHSDLIANILAVSTVSLLVTALIGSVIVRLILRGQLTVQFVLPNEEIISERRIPVKLLLNNISIPPFFGLTLTAKFRQDKGSSSLVSQPLIRVRRLSSDSRVVMSWWRFPHRGVWEVDSVFCSLSDALGFTSMSWTMPLVLPVKVLPPPFCLKPLPIISATFATGEIAADEHDRQGDPFDMRPYNPADGVTRVLWKIYARTEQLVVRQREPAAIPEGEVAIFVVAAREDDNTAAAAISYLSQLEQLNIGILLGTDGLTEGVGHGFVDSNFIIGRERAIDALLYCVWSDAAGSAEDLAGFTHGLQRSGRAVQEVIVFVNDASALPHHIEAFARSSQVRLSIVTIIPTLGTRRTYSTKLQSMLPNNWNRESPQSASAQARNIPGLSVYVGVPLENSSLS